MTLTREQLDALVDRIYEAALSPALWEEVLAETSRAIQAPGGSLLWTNGIGTRLVRADGWNLDPEVLTIYERHYIDICPRTAMSRARWVGDIFDDRPARASKRDRIRDYYDVLDRYGYGHARILVVERSPELAVRMNFYRPIHDDSRPDEEQVLRVIWPHLRRASHMTLRVAEVAGRADLGDALWELSTAMLHLDGSGRVLRMNSRAEAVLALSDGLSFVAGQVHAAQRADDLKLAREIRTALARGEASGPAPDGFALVRRPSKRPAWAVSVVPLPAQLRGGRTKSPPQALMTVVETVPRASPEWLRRGFGLSAAEAEIAAALAGGQHIDAIADARGASLATVRGQLKGVFAKLEVSCQAELVGRISASLGARRSSGPD